MLDIDGNGKIPPSIEISLDKIQSVAKATAATVSDFVIVSAWCAYQRKQKLNLEKEKQDLLEVIGI